MLWFLNSNINNQCKLHVSTVIYFRVTPLHEKPKPMHVFLNFFSCFSRPIWRLGRCCSFRHPLCTSYIHFPTGKYEKRSIISTTYLSCTPPQIIMYYAERTFANSFNIVGFTLIFKLTTLNVMCSS